ncbi:Uncharacterised protein [Shigella sonnei]|nr:Uncharacterised protein [Shigella sonnei]CSI00017.1 Uncharacterised protein [Shigella sonnei]
MLHFCGALIPGVIDIGEFIGQGFDLIFQIWHTGAQAWLSAKLFQRDPGGTARAVFHLGIIGVGVSL